MVRPGVIVEVAGEGVDRTDLVEFARCLEDVGDQEWDAFLTAAGDAAVVVRSEEPVAAADRPAADARFGVAVQGLTGDAAWRVSVPSTAPNVRRCVTLEVGSIDADECLDGGDVELLTYDVGDATVVVIVTPGSAAAQVVAGGEPRLADGRVADLWVGWWPAEYLAEPVTITLADGTTYEISVGPDSTSTTTSLPASGDDVEPSEDGSTPEQLGDDRSGVTTGEGTS
jgi:hypothetical protein